MDIDPDLVCQTLYLAKFTPSYCKGPLPLKSDDSFCISQHPPPTKKCSLMPYKLQTKHSCVTGPRPANWT